jgi:1-pyrroline-5-carboxylate dehydrogenase
MAPPTPINEPVRTYAPGTPERASLKAELARAAGEVVEIPLVIGGERIRTGDLVEVVMPHDKAHRLARAHRGTAAHVERAVAAARSARREWAGMSFEDRAAVFLRAADLLAGPWRDRANAATMLGQSKTVYQSEIDAVAELADFWRWNVHYAEQIAHASQPISTPGTWNRLELRPLDGFVFAITPFNFSSIGGNLPTAPAIFGNTVLWKPAQTQLLSAYTILRILEAAGLPPGVINLLSGPAAALSGAILDSPELGGIHFTGSTEVFNALWAHVGKNIGTYRQYPRLVGETGGKDFVFAHPSAEIEPLAVALVRGAFEYQGQKCSAASRAYVPRSLWPALKERLVADVRALTFGDVRDFSHFMGAVIDDKAFKKIGSYQELALAGPDTTVLAGGHGNDERGWFIEPTLVETRDPKHRLMREEIFGPVLTLWVYEDQQLEEALTLCDTATPYALTGAVFAQDRAAIAQLSRVLRFSAGNFYVNDKPTGAVVGQQPFGGSRASGTNDKAGSLWNLMRWVSPRTLKENFVPPRSVRYPHMGEP